MSNMNGNPHAVDAERLIGADNTWQGVGYETADAQHIVGHIEANTQATLALAYEQRTANLIAKLALNTQVATGGVHLNSVAESIDDEIMARLGLNDEVTA